MSRSVAACQRDSNANSLVARTIAGKDATAIALDRLAANEVSDQISSADATGWSPTSWGPGDLSGEVLIAVGISRKDLEESFESVTPAGHVWSRYARPYDNDLTIYVVRGPKVPFEQVWRALRSYI